jgi:Phosphoribosylaminoimidazolesuccinocarboxamide (SAICAR) synthase
LPSTLLQSDLPGLDLIHRGKVRDVYGLPGNRLVIVASDRLSAFDVVLPDPIPGKGEMLTQISNFWFARTAHLMPNHLLDTPWPRCCRRAPTCRSTPAARWSRAG